MESIYTRVGGEAGVRRLVSRFYQVMDSDPFAAGIRAMHKGELAPIEEKLFLFLSFWMGGPRTYVDVHGPPMMRRRHLPFPIGDHEAEQWMYCMRIALTDTVEDAQLRMDLEGAFTRIAKHMRNQEA